MVCQGKENPCLSESPLESHSYGSRCCFGPRKMAVGTGICVCTLAHVVLSLELLGAEIRELFFVIVSILILGVGDHTQGLEILPFTSVVSV